MVAVYTVWHNATAFRYTWNLKNAHSYLIYNTVYLH